MEIAARAGKEAVEKCRIRNKEVYFESEIIILS